jgi:hypothetical protein
LRLILYDIFYIDLMFWIRVNFSHWRFFYEKSFLSGLFIYFLHIEKLLV